MPDLATFQESFGAALASHADGTDPRVARALAVHRNTAAKGAIDALAANYPVVAALIGEDAFGTIAHDFYRRHPPVEPRLCLYGVDFPSHVAAHPGLIELPYLGDVARLERLVVEALFAADAAALDGEAIMARLDQPRPFRLHPALRWASFATPAVGLWLAHQPDAAPEALATIDWVAQTVLVTRPQDAVLVAVSDPGAADLLDAYHAGLSLTEASSRVGADLSGTFAALIAAGAFA